MGSSCSGIKKNTTSSPSPTPIDNETEYKNKIPKINENSFIKNKKQLICDDIFGNRLALGKYLTRFNCEFDEAENGMDALIKVCNNGEYDIIWMDIKMPKLDGIECTKILRNNYSYKGKIIGLTGFIDNKTRKKAIDAGMDLILSKPLDKQVILMYVESIDK